jgi:CRP-like cAMP-binding protein
MARINGRAALRPLIAKLSNFIPLSSVEVDALQNAIGREERIAPRQTLVEAGEKPPIAFVLIRGMAYRFQLISDGRRHILSLMLPGDFFDLHSYLLRTVSYSIATLIPTTIAVMDRACTDNLITHHPRLAAGFRCCSQQEEAILHARLIGLGRANARRRLAFLLCEMVCRQRAIGLTEDHSVWLPLTQADMADMLGLTPVHVNRVIQEFRRENLIRMERRRLTLSDYGNLAKLAEFDGEYLGLDGVPEAVLAYLDGLKIEQ